ncbi:hypothetical protein BDZ90DRAFT_33370 [Jaminaea rosea]|uniref:J domain-containing protein n=1 Tax=Jaminaea rosea TaxID=1569628 RepID=A0A316V0K3_9BASI|nr:hypothetical protein BDZ90DRAFT_33370 [Jaminaea rosea]PWN31080.1 hypothetical protein BDZ90DRAFT_33370 [Jaminaea rosea]
MSSALISYAPWLGWAFLPSLATKYLLDALYTSHLLPRPTTPQQAHSHATRTRILLIGAYLAYQFSTSLSSSEPTAYRLLDVDVEADVEVVKRSFRRLAKVHHPDKVGPSGERFFIALRRSHDVLTDSVRRFAYDRFGIAVLDWRGALTVREYMVIGLRESLLWWVVNSAIFAVLSWLNGLGGAAAGRAASPWSYWHLALLASLASAELFLVTAPARPPLLRQLLPRHTVGDLVAVLRQTYTSTIMAMRQILPLLGDVSPGVGEIKTLAEAHKFIEALAGEMDKLGVGALQMREQSDAVLRAEMEPFHALGHVEATSSSSASGGGATLRQRSDLERSFVDLMSQQLIDRSLQASPEVQRAIGERRAQEQQQQQQSSSAPSARPGSADAPSSIPPPPLPFSPGKISPTSPPTSPRSSTSGMSLQPRVSERRSSLSSSKGKRRSSSGAAGAEGAEAGGHKRTLTNGSSPLVFSSSVESDMGQRIVSGAAVVPNGAAFGLDVPAGLNGNGMPSGQQRQARDGVDPSRQVPPYPQSPKLGGTSTITF